MARARYLPILFQLFRERGYDGVSLAEIAAQTGLGKASLYHYFPGGKAEMLQAAIAHAEAWFEENIAAELASTGSAQQRFKAMCDRLNNLYESGAQPCLLATLASGGPVETFQAQIKSQLRALVAAIAQVLIEEGVDSDVAHERAEDAVISIQGALIVSRGTGDLAPFQRVMSQLPGRLCEGL